MALTGQGTADPHIGRCGGPTTLEAGVASEVAEVPMIVVLKTQLWPRQIFASPWSHHVHQSPDTISSARVLVFSKPESGGL